MQNHRALISALILSIFLTACAPRAYAPVVSQATAGPAALAVTQAPSKEPSPAASSTPAPSPTPAMASHAWEFDSTCGAVPAVRSASVGDAFWTLRTNDDSGVVKWDLRSDKAAVGFQWTSFRQIKQPDSSNQLYFIGTDQNQKNWLVVVHSRCSKGAELALLLPLPDADPVFSSCSFMNEAKDYECWLLEEKKLTVYVVKDKIGQLVWETDQILPYTGFTIREAGDINQDSKRERYVSWWNWNGYEITDQRNVQKTQILSEEASGFKLIGEIEPSWGMIDLKNDGVVEFLKPVPPDSPEKWDIYRFQGEKYDWDGQVEIPEAQAPVVVQPDQLPPLPNDLYFIRDNQGFIWPKEGGSFRTVEMMQPEVKLSPCSGKRINPEEKVMWSPNCRYRVEEKPGEIEGGSSIIVDQLTGKQFDVPNSFVYARGLTTFAWGPDSKFVIYASADGNPGLFRIDVPSFEIKPIVPFQSVDAFLSYGPAFPTVLEDGSVVFVVEAARTDLYPPPGVYRLMADGTLLKLASLPAATLFDEGNRLIYGDFFPSPTGEAFLFAEHNDYYALPHYLSMLIVDADGKTVWNASPVLENADDFRWLP